MELATKSNSADNLKIGIGLDSCLLPTRFDNISILQTVDFFYPLIDDPYLMGKITCANVLSDLYATGVVEVDELRMIFSISTQMTESERDVVMPLIIKGFKDNAKSVGVTTTLKSATVNPWCIIGGIATSACLKSEYINPLNAQVGDVLVLTKPLGAQMACNANRWLQLNSDKWKAVSKVASEQQIRDAFDTAVKNMIRLNRNAAQLMHKYKAHGATDVTGFGILGHAENLAKFQTSKVKFIVHTLPIIKNMLVVSEAASSKQKMLIGRAPETSGGLLICLKENIAQDYCNDIKKIDNCEAWIIGKVEEGENTAEITKNPIVIEV